MSSVFVFEQLEAQGEIVGGSVSPADRAAVILAEAQSRAGEIERAAREAGFEAGRAEMHEVTRAEMAAPRAALMEAVAAIEAMRQDAASSVELHAVELAVVIAERILGAALAVDPTLVLGVVESALRRALTRDGLTIDVNPEDAEIVRAWLADGGAEGAGIEVRPERRVARGGCIVRTREGEIDAQLGEQLARAEETLRQVFASGGE